MGYGLHLRKLSTYICHYYPKYLEKNIYKDILVHSQTKIEKK